MIEQVFYDFSGWSQCPTGRSSRSEIASATRNNRRSSGVTGVEMAIQSTILRSLALRMALAALAVLLIEVVYPAAIAAQTGP